MLGRIGLIIEACGVAWSPSLRCQYGSDAPRVARRILRRSALKRVEYAARRLIDAISDKPSAPRITVAYAFDTEGRLVDWFYHPSKTVVKKAARAWRNADPSLEIERVEYVRKEYGV